jgi:hypothetical protein
MIAGVALIGMIVSSGCGREAFHVDFGTHSFWGFVLCRRVATTDLRICYMANGELPLDTRDEKVPADIFLNSQSTQIGL